MAKDYRVCVIGHTGRGNYGHGIDEVWLHVPNVEIVAVADADKRGLADTARKLGDVARISTIGRCSNGKNPIWSPSVLAGSINIVTWSWPPSTPARNVYMEKPFCRTLAEADEIVTACEQTHAKLAIAHTTRYSPMIPVIKEIIQSGRIGRVLEYRGRGKSDRRGGRRRSVGARQPRDGPHPLLRRRTPLVQCPRPSRRPRDPRRRRHRGKRRHRAARRRFRRRDVRPRRRRDCVLRLAAKRRRQSLALWPPNLRLRRRHRTHDRLPAAGALPRRTRVGRPAAVVPRGNACRPPALLLRNPSRTSIITPGTWLP